MIHRKKVVIIGGGAAGLIAAELLSATHDVHIYEKGKAAGRKFLVAGKGGFNLTNNVDGEELYSKYQPYSLLHKSLTSYDTKAFRQWLLKLGVPTYVGSSGRVFPEKGIKPIEVLQKILDKLHQKNVQFYFQHEFLSFNNDNQIVVKQKENNINVSADYFIFALGGASWSVTGSDGKWINSFDKVGVKTFPFQASNCGVSIDWPKEFTTNFAGTPLKNIQVSIDDFSVKGEVLITEYGLEGNAIYPAIPSIRQKLNQKEAVCVNIDLKPQNTLEELLQKISGKNIQTKNYKHVFNLSGVQIALLKLHTIKEDYLSPDKFCKQIKKLKIPITSLRPIEEAISTVGGICKTEVNSNFSLKAYPKIFVIGEMIDWDAPTGGFLLQGCFSTAAYAAQSILNFKE